eukprot:scaffold679181_cov43-Prasinocladus_malaysianus.AAC.1
MQNHLPDEPPAGMKHTSGELFHIALPEGFACRSPAARSLPRIPGTHISKSQPPQWPAKYASSICDCFEIGRAVAQQRRRSLCGCRGQFFYVLVSGGCTSANVFRPSP